MIVPIPALFLLLPGFLLHTVKRAAESENARDKRHLVRTRVARSSVETHSLAALWMIRVAIQNAAVDCVENETRHDRCHCHRTPIQSETRRSEGVTYQRREAAKQTTIREARETGQPVQVIWVFDSERGDLCGNEECRRYNQRPVSGRMQPLHHKVGADTRSEASEKGEERQNADMHELACLDEVVGGRIVPVVP